MAFSLGLLLAGPGSIDEAAALLARAAAGMPANARAAYNAGLALSRRSDAPPRRSGCCGGRSSSSRRATTTSSLSPTSSSARAGPPR